MTVLEAQGAAHRGGGKMLARTPDEAGGDIAVWSCTPCSARADDRYWWILP